MDLKLSLGHLQRKAAENAHLSCSVPWEFVDLQGIC